MEMKMIHDGEAVKYGWNTFKENVGLFIGLIVVAAIACGLPLLIGTYAGQDSTAVFGIFMLLYYLVAIVIGMGFIKIFAKFGRGEKAGFGDLFNSWNRFLPYLGVTILYGLIVFGGMLLLVFPGVIWSIKFYFAQWLVVDKGMGPIEALKASAEMTNGLKWDMFGFMAVTGVVMLIGYVALLVGLVASVPTAMLAMGKVYNQLSSGMPMGGGMEKKTMEKPAAQPMS